MTTAIFDADSHVMETADWLPAFADPGVRDRLFGLGLEGAGAGAAKLMAELPALWAGHRDQEIGADVLTGPKGWRAPGAQPRPRSPIVQRTRQVHAVSVRGHRLAGGAVRT